MVAGLMVEETEAAMVVVGMEEAVEVAPEVVVQVAVRAAVRAAVVLEVVRAEEAWEGGVLEEAELEAVELAEEAQEVAETVTVERVEVATLEGGEEDWARLPVPAEDTGAAEVLAVVGTATGLLEEGEKVAAA